MTLCDNQMFIIFYSFLVKTLHKVIRHSFSLIMSQILASKNYHTTTLPLEHCILILDEPRIILEQHSSSRFYLNNATSRKCFNIWSQVQGVCRQSAKAKLKNRHFNGAYRGSKPFFLTLQTGLKFPVDKRNIKDVYYSQFQQQENSAKLQILHFWRCLKTWSFALYWP